ncbi:MAG: hypothetical protein K8I27_06490 [Planctomycetes bacterium]|nr:hypothetical protein [Planctomycetota bacterium]
MAQRIHQCPACSAAVAVPDGYFRATIACPQCRAELIRHSGELAEPGYAVPAGQAQARPQQAVPPQYAAGYPQYGPPPQYAGYANPPVKGRRWWLIPVILVPVVAVLGILGLALIPLFVGGSVAGTGDWYTHRDEKAQYMVEFPREPRIGSESVDTEMGSRQFQTASVLAGGIAFEVGWMDMGPGRESDYFFDYKAAAAAFVAEKDAWVSSQTQYMVGRYVGSIAICTDKAKVYSTIVMVRRGNRVYTVLAENHKADQQEVVDRFIQSFTLLEESAAAGDGLTMYDKVGNYWMTRTTVYSGGPDNVQHVMRTEVKAISGFEITLMTHSQMGGDTIESEHQIDLREWRPAYADVKSSRTVTLTVEAGTFECRLYESTASGTKTWICAKTGLTVKVESGGGPNSGSVIELIRTNVK